MSPPWHAPPAARAQAARTLAELAGGLGAGRQPDTASKPIEEMTLEEFSANKNFLHFSRIPVYSGNPENITGFVYRQVVLENLANDRFGIKLSEIRKPIMVAPNIQPLTVLWERLLAEKTHITMIVDEYGGFEGIVTLEDIIETILGLEIMDERDVAADMQQYARERWKERAEKYKHLPN